MKLLAILVALGLEQWQAFHWRATVEREYIRYLRTIERRLNGGTRGQAVVALLLAILPPVALVAALGWGAQRMHPALGLLLNIAILYLLMGFRRFSHAVSAIIAALKDGDLGLARRALAGWR